MNSHQHIDIHLSKTIVDSSYRCRFRRQCDLCPLPPDVVLFSEHRADEADDRVVSRKIPTTSVLRGAGSTNSRPPRTAPRSPLPGLSRPAASTRAAGGARSCPTGSQPHSPRGRPAWPAKRPARRGPRRRRTHARRARLRTGATIRRRRASVAEALTGALEPSARGGWAPRPLRRPAGTGGCTCACDELIEACPSRSATTSMPLPASTRSLP